MGIARRLGQLFPDDGGGPHPGHRGLGLFIIGGFRIFPQSHFHRGRSQEKHFLHPAAVGLHRAELPAHRIGAARAGHHRGDACRQRLSKTGVQRIDRIQGPQLRSGRIGALVAVVPLEAQTVLPHAQMAVGVDKAWEKPASRCIKQLSLRRAGLLHGADGGDFPLFDFHKTVLNGRRVDGKYPGVDNAHTGNLQQTAKRGGR